MRNCISEARAPLEAKVLPAQHWNNDSCDTQASKNRFAPRLGDKLTLCSAGRLPWPLGIAGAKLACGRPALPNGSRMFALQFFPSPILRSLCFSRPESSGNFSSHCFATGGWPLWRKRPPPMRTTTAEYEISLEAAAAQWGSCGALLN